MRSYDTDINELHKRIEALELENNTLEGQRINASAEKKKEKKLSIIVSNDVRKRSDRSNSAHRER